MSNIPKPVKVLTDLTTKQKSTTKKGLLVSGSINTDCNIGLDVEKDARLNGDVYVSGYTHATGFSQVGALGVLGFLDINGHVKVAETLRISGSSDFLSISETRDEENTYLVDQIIHALDKRFAGYREIYNSNKEMREFSITEVNNDAEFTSKFMYDIDVRFVSIDIKIFDSDTNSWHNYLTAVEMLKDTSPDPEKYGRVKFKLTLPDILDVGEESKVCIIVTRQTDITFND